MEDRVYVLGVYTELYIKGIEYLIYDIKISDDGVRLNNLGDVGKVLTNEVRNQTPNIIDLKYKDIKSNAKDKLSEYDFSNTIFLYNVESLNDNTYYIPYTLTDGEYLVRYVLKDKLEVLVFNVIKNVRGKLVSYEVTDDDMISLAGLGINNYVKSVQDLMEEMKY